MFKVGDVVRYTQSVETPTGHLIRKGDVGFVVEMQEHDHLRIRWLHLGETWLHMKDYVEKINE